MSIGSIIHHFSRGCKNTTKVDVTPQSGLDLARYMGRWYEQARLENWFEKGMDDVFTDYAFEADGHVRVDNYGTSAKEKHHHSRGKGFLSAPGQLQVSFVPPFWWFKAPYRILYVDEAYQSALVSGNDAEYLWLLTRQRCASVEMLQALVLEALRRGFDVDALRPTRQSGS